MAGDRSPSSAADAHRASPWLAVLLVCSGLTAVGLAQQRSTFRAGVETVAVYATVTDSHGTLVPDLSQADFEIREDGKLQPLTVFEAGVQPITIAVLLDESPSLAALASRIRAAADEFLRKLLPDDRAVFGNFTQTVRLDDVLTHDAGVLQRQMDRHDTFSTGTALWDALDRARAVLQPLGGRRVVLTLSDGNDNCSFSDSDDVRHAIEADGLLFYGIGIRGTDDLPLAEMKDLAKHSGGWFFELKPSDDLVARFQRVADELHRQYVLGFTPRQIDGKVHKIDVRVRKSGMTVRARQTYVAESRK
jgi:VWFA-related protein